MTKPITHASVFSGIGGPEVAAEMLGWVNLFHCEINPFGRAVLDYWFPNSASYEDITNTDFTPWRGRVNVLTGGFPCQPFSYAGKRRGAEDDRYLWPYMFRCIDQIQPDWVVCENVAGILTMVEQGEVSQMADQATLFDQGDRVPRYELRETFTLQRICDDLSGHGYEVQPVLIPACGVGAPHRRDRVFIVGHRTSADSDERADGRNPREHEGAGREERVQERDQVRLTDQPSQVRPAGARDAADAANSIGQGLEREDESRSNQGREWLHLRGDSAGCCGSDVRGYAPNAHGEGWQESQQPGGGTHSEKEGTGLDNRAERLGSDGSASHTENQRAGEQFQPGCAECGGPSVPKPGNRLGASYSEGDTCGIRWRDFPTVSPIHRGNDGLPFPVDNLTIPFSRWRTEALKAYGNAIVPQVMYEIFRAIELVENNNQ